MGFWSRLLGRGATGELPTDAEKGETRPEERREHARTEEPFASGVPLPSNVAALLATLAAPRPEVADALRRFAELRRTAEEASAIEELTRRDATRRLPEPLAVAVGRALVERGEPLAAERLLSHATSSDALILAADLAAERGDLPSAVAEIERVLLQNFDHPGARERHRRWQAALGLGREVRRPIPVGSTVVTSEPDAPYVLLREVARGGSGAVYEAEDRDLLRRAALKVYHEPERQRAQLAHEARVAAAFSGPGVVRVFDVDPDHGWLALEWVAEGALRDVLRAGDLARLLPIERWAIPLATALARVHRAGWVHLDVKPANVLLPRPERPLLTDFGIARRSGEPSVPGSLGYVSPERVAGRAADPRDDVYGFGRILEEALRCADDSALTARFRAITDACLAPDASRLASAHELLVRLRNELA